MAHYLIDHIDINYREKYAKYESGFLDFFLIFYGKILSVEENEHLLEGQWPFTRTVLIEFPSQEDALDWYNSIEYQVLVQHRFAASTANIVIVSGLD